MRKFSKEFLKGDDLVRFGSITEEVLELLKHLVACKYNIFISGGTSSGKTTFLNLLATFISPKERVITIEDSAELKLMGLENLISMEARSNNLEGKGGISIADLIKTSLRMRPDRIIVGESQRWRGIPYVNSYEYRS
nr:ATPase, T2SS/T4P/T4SS family [endosymbiont 'TC1' of Trimyema compressum]